MIGLDWIQTLSCIGCCDPPNEAWGQDSQAEEHLCIALQPYTPILFQIGMSRTGVYNSRKGYCYHKMTADSMQRALLLAILGVQEKASFPVHQWILLQLLEAGADKAVAGAGKRQN